MRSLLTGGVVAALIAIGTGRAFAQAGAATPAEERERQGSKDVRQRTVLAAEMARAKASACLARAEAHFRHRDFRAALREFNLAVAREAEERGKPGYASLYAKIYSQRAITFAALDDFQSATEDFERAVQCGPPSAKLLHARASLHWRLGRFDEARKDLVAATRLDWRFAPAYLELARIDRSQGEAEQAVEQLTEGLRQCGEEPSLLQARASLLVDKQDHKSALADINRWIALAPKDGRAYYERAQIHLALGETERAKEDFDSAVAFDSDNRSLRLARAEFHRSRGSASIALADATAAIRLDGRDPEAYILRAEIHEQLLDIDGAAADYGRAVEAGGSEPSLLRRRAWFFERYALTSKAMADYTAAIHGDPEYFDCYLDRAVLLAKQGEFEAAIDDLSRVIELNPQAYQAYIERAKIWLDNQEPAKAIQDVNQAVAIAPMEPLVYSARATILERLGKQKEARADMNRASELKSAAASQRQKR
jgi:tetratricopeptide (TPR) repeat protein